jgi:hypothetical protein
MSETEVLPPDYVVPQQQQQAVLVARPEKLVVTHPSIPRLPLQDNAIALLLGQPGAGWCVFRDTVETTGLIAIAMLLMGGKDVLKYALASAILIEATAITYTAVARRTGETM